MGQIDIKVRELGTRIDDHGGQRIRNVGRPIDPSDAANKEFVVAMHGEVAAVHGEVAAVSEAVEAASEAIEAVKQNKNNMGGHFVTNVKYPTENNHAATKEYVDDELLFFDGFSGIPGRLRQIKILTSRQKIPT